MLHTPRRRAGGAIPTSSMADIAFLLLVFPASPSLIAAVRTHPDAIGVHLVVGYTDVVHLAPAVFGALLFGSGIALAYGPMVRDRTPAATRRCTARIVSAE
ncbi:MAG TPA: hypothetical protein VMM12_04915 [Longimicrobiales bacterium]|nr:hypothetical protein [Longimicrobiales bacterium]